MAHLEGLLLRVLVVPMIVVTICIAILAFYCLYKETKVIALISGQRFEKE